MDFVGWRSIFYVNVPLGIITIALGLTVLPRFAPDVRSGFDIWGFLTSAAGLGLVFLGLSEGQSWGWGSESIVLLLAGGVWLLVIFVLVELASPHPLIDLRLFQYKVFTLSILLVMVCTIALYAADFFVPLFMQEIQGRTALQSGLTLLPSGLAMAVFMPLAGRAYDRVGARVPVVLGMLGLIAATLLFSRLGFLTTDTSIAVWMSLRNVALGIAWMPAATAGLSVVPIQNISRASALNNICSRIASAMGLAVLTSSFTGVMAQRVSDLASNLTHFNPVLDQLVRSTSGVAARTMQTAAAQLPSGANGLSIASQVVEAHAFADAVHAVFAYTTVLSMIGLVVAVFLRERRHRQGAGAPAVH